jgi:hypothetical protein
MKYVTPGEWTLLVVSEEDPDSRWYTRRCKALRSIFLTRDVDTNGLIACQAEEFYERVTRTPLQNTLPEVPFQGACILCLYLKPI